MSLQSCHLHTILSCFMSQTFVLSCNVIICKFHAIHWPPCSNCPWALEEALEQALTVCKITASKHFYMSKHSGTLVLNFDLRSRINISAGPATLGSGTRFVRVVLWTGERAKVLHNAHCSIIPAYILLNAHWLTGIPIIQRIMVGIISAHINTNIGIYMHMQLKY